MKAAALAALAALLAAGDIPVPRETPIRLMVLNEVSTASASAGDRFPLRVDEPVIVNGTAIIAAGTRGWGEVLHSEQSGRGGKAGKLDVRLVSVELDGRQIPITGELNHKGRDGRRQVLLGSYSLGPLALLARGNEGKLKAGDVVTAYFEDEMLYDPATRRLSPR